MRKVFKIREMLARERAMNDDLPFLFPQKDYWPRPCLQAHLLRIIVLYCAACFDGDPAAMKVHGWLSKPFLTSLFLGIGGFLYGLWVPALTQPSPVDTP